MLFSVLNRRLLTVTTAQSRKNRIMMVACILQRDPIIMQKPAKYPIIVNQDVGENSEAPIPEVFPCEYEKYRELLYASNARTTFDIMTAHKDELRKFSDENKQEHQSVQNTTKVDLREFAIEYQKADLDKKMQDIRRRLDRKLYFVIRDDQGRWVFPSQIFDVREKTCVDKVTIPNASMKQEENQTIQAESINITKFNKNPDEAATEMIRRCLGESWEIYAVGHAPVASHQEDFEVGSVRINNQSLGGSDTFFFRAHAVGGEMIFRPIPGASDYAWSTKDELSFLMSPSYYQSVRRVLSY